MTKGRAQNPSEPPNIWEQAHFWVLFYLLFSWFLISEVFKLITLRRERNSGTCWREAQRLAHSLTPYAFMRI